MARLTDLKEPAQRYRKAAEKARIARMTFYRAPYGGGLDGLFRQAQRELEIADRDTGFAADQLARAACQALGLAVAPLVSMDEIDRWQAESYAWTAFHTMFEDVSLAEALLHG